MNRRNFSKAIGGAFGLASAVDQLAAQSAESGDIDPARMPRPMQPGPPIQVAMLIHPHFVLQDLFGAHLFLAGLMNVKVHLVWKTRELVLSEKDVSILPTATLDECPKDLDVLFVPGGLTGTVAMMKDPQVMGFLEDRGKRAKYVTSVCTGSPLLGAAGLLRGYKATSHSTVRGLLPLMGAETVAERVVVDRNRITGGGVTAGLDFGLTIAAKIRGDAYAEFLQLMDEYDPRPPFHSGSPETAYQPLVKRCRQMREPAVEEARRTLKEITKAWS